jgi:GAF domain-containing protein
MSQSPSPDLGGALAELAGLLLSTESLEMLLQEVAELSVQVVEPAVTAGITLKRDNRTLTVAAANQLATQLDEQQYEQRTGPCLQALATGQIVHARDMAAEDRWDYYPTIALGYGIRAVLSLPMVVENAPIGVLNLYADRADPFDDVARQLAELLTRHATIAVAAALRRHDQLQLSENLRVALSSRAIIDQAIGIVMAQRRCGSDEAFATLRAISQHRHVKLRQVAADIVDAIGRPSSSAHRTGPRARRTDDS